jgi:hypothetical protein
VEHQAGLHVAGLWHFPLKTLAGVELLSTVVGRDGIAGDRLVRVMGPEGVRTSRRHYRLLGLRGTLDPSGEPLINGHPWSSPEALALVRAAAGDDAWLERTDEGVRYDILPLLVATDGAVAAFGRDVRRLRPNILVGGVAGLAERDWPGAELHFAGGAIVRLDSLRARCPMTTVDPDSLERDPEVLRDIGRRFGGYLALNAEVVRGGIVRVGERIGFPKGVCTASPTEKLGGIAGTYHSASSTATDRTFASKSMADTVRYRMVVEPAGTNDGGQHRDTLFGEGVRGVFPVGSAADV